jgi:hypothetical protein
VERRFKLLHLRPMFAFLRCQMLIPRALFALLSHPHLPACSSHWSWQGVTVQDVTFEVARRWRHRSEDAREAQAALMAARDAATALYPVSVDFDPPFDLLVPRAGRGERQSGADVAAAITTHGSWQPSVQPSRRPSLTDAVVGSMGGADSRQNVLVGKLLGAAFGFCVSAGLLGRLRLPVCLELVGCVWRCVCLATHSCSVCPPMALPQTWAPATACSRWQRLLRGTGCTLSSWALPAWRR